jgi:conjugal transfer mating pair stabilization protein TraG
MNWEVFSYGGGDFLRVVFNAIASIFGNSDYGSAMATSSMLGFIIVFTKSVFSRDLMENFRWYIGMIVFIMVVLTPKQTVIINDRVTPANSAVVNNVPIGLAVTAGFFSFTGDWLTRAFEVVFSMPAQAKYSGNGLLFANQLYEESRGFEFPDDRVDQNFQEFFISCVVVDGIGQKRFEWRDVLMAPTLTAFFSANVAQNAAHFKYVASSGTESILPCRSGFTNNVRPEMEALWKDVIQFGVSGGLIGRFNSAAAASTKVETEMQALMSYLTGVGQTAQTTVVQQAIINSMANGVHRLSQETNATEFNEYIISGAELQRLTSYQAAGNIASEKLPLLKVLIEAFLYAIFPIIALMAIVSPVKVSSGYGKALIWINMWAPMYAILHFAMQYWSTEAMTELANLNGNGFSVMANNKLATFNADVVATTGYLSTSLPVIAWMLVSSSGALAASFAGKIMQGYESSVDKTSDEMTKGEGQRLGEDWRMTESMQVQSQALLDTGSSLTTTGDGRQFLGQNGSQLQVSSQSVESSVASRQQAFDSAVSEKQSEASQLSSANSAVIQNASSALEQASKNSGVSNNFSSGESVQQQQNFEKLNSSMDEWAKQNNVELTDQVRASIYGQVEASGGFSLFGNGVSAKGGASLDGSTAETQKDSYGTAERFMESEKFSETVSSAATAARNTAIAFGVSSSDSSIQKLDSAVSDQSVAKQDFTESVERVDAAKQSLNESQELRQALTVDNGQAMVSAAASVGVGVRELDSMIRTATESTGTESVQAMNELKQIMVESEMIGGGNNPGFAEAKAALFSGPETTTFANNLDARYGEGAANVESSNQESKQFVANEGAANSDKVASKQQISQSTVDSATGSALSNQQNAMNNPQISQTSSGAGQAIQDGKKEIIDGANAPGGVVTNVENAQYIEGQSPLPFAVMGYNEGSQEAALEQLQEKIKSR